MIFAARGSPGAAEIPMRNPAGPIVVLALVLVASVAGGQEAKPASGAPPSDAEVTAAITEGVALLLKTQENYKMVGETRRPRAPRPTPGGDAKDPSPKEPPKPVAESKPAAGATAGPAREWPYEGVYRVAGDVPPGYRVGGTCIVCWSLMEAPGFAADVARRDAVTRGLVFSMDELEKNPLLSASFDGTYDTRGWAHTYGLLVLLRALDLKALDGPQTERAGKLVKQLVKTLEVTEIKETGGWNYSRGGGFEKPAGASTFMTPPTLQALFSAKAHGLAVNPAVVNRALKTIEDARVDGKAAVQYGTNPKRKSGKGIEDEPGSCARTAVCETTLMLAGRGSVDRIRASVNAFFAGWKELDARRAKSGTHEGPYAIAPYFFHYGHTYCAQAIEMLPEAERPALRAKLREYYWKTREADGSWNDRVFPRSAGFGTAMSMLGLMTPALPAVPAWKP